MHCWSHETAGGSDRIAGPGINHFDPKTRLALCLRCEKAAEINSEKIRIKGLPAAGYFHPDLPAHTQICDSAAEQWMLSAGNQAHEILQGLTDRGIASLILAADASRCPRFHKAAITSYRGTVELSNLEPVRLLSAFRRLEVTSKSPLNVHGVLMRMYDLGVLLMGDSGVGKSELALELLSRGHQLVSDDAVELRHIGHRCLLGSSPELLAGFVEARGLGILDAGALFGRQAIAPPARIDLVFELYERPVTLKNVPPDVRLHGLRSVREFLGEPIPVISLSRRLGHNLAVLVEAGCRDHWLRLAGYHADACFIKKQQYRIDSGIDQHPPD